MANLFEVLDTRKHKTTIQWQVDLDVNNKNVNSLEFDAVLNEGHGSTITVTENPVEDGADVTDHVEVKPKTFTLDAVVSNDPITLQSALLGNVTSALGNIPAPVKQISSFGVSKIAGFLLDNDSKNRTRDAYTILRSLQDNRILVSIVTQLTTYSNMIITNISAPRTQASGGGITFSLTFQEVRIVSSATVALPEINTQAASAVPTKKLGSKATKSLTDAVEAKAEAKSSILFKVFGG